MKVYAFRGPKIKGRSKKSEEICFEESIISRNCAPLAGKKGGKAGKIESFAYFIQNLRPLPNEGVTTWQR